MASPSITVSLPGKASPSSSSAGKHLLLRGYGSALAQLLESTGGDVLWHEQGMRFSWRVMLREKNGSVTYRVRVPGEARERLISPTRYLTPYQEREMSGRPDMILQLAHHIGADFAALASGNAEPPWQREVLEQSYRLVPLDTLSPIAGTDPASAELDPLAGLERLAIIQPRGLSPADNVALDRWVRKGGELLIALDPALSLDYPVPLGDPRRPTATALIPPVIGRWGLAIAYDDHSIHGHAQDLAPTSEPLGEGELPLLSAGRVAPAEQAKCISAAKEAVAKCEVGAGTVTVLADASVFEHRLNEAGQGRGSQAAISNLFKFAFSQ